MDGTQIRRLRRHAGLTQEALAERIGVEQGTVSRWERNVEQPRPRSASALKDLLLGDLERSVTLRQRGMVRNNLVTGGLLDVQSRLKEVSKRAEKFYRRRSNFDIHQDIGKPLEQQLAEKGGEATWSVVERSGILHGEASLVRFFVSHKRLHYLTHYEPIYEDGAFTGVFAYIARSTTTETDHPTTGLRYADVLHTDDPGKLSVLHRGVDWQAAKDHLENDWPF